MLFFLSLGLLPLGLIAVLASLQSARENRAIQFEDLKARLEFRAERIDGAISRGMLMLRTAGAPGGLLDVDAERCGATIQALARSEQLPGRYALFSGGTPRCVTSDYRAAGLTVPAGVRSAIEIAPDAQSVRFWVMDGRGIVQGAGELNRAELIRLTDLPGPNDRAILVLTGQDRRMLLRDSLGDDSGGDHANLAQPLLGSDVRLNLIAARTSISPAELLIILLPVLMWIAAATIGWLIIDRLLLRPLWRMQRAVAAYQPGDRDLALPLSASPAREIGELGAAFERVTQTVARHEAELEAGLDRQKRLVREVHHRVKNNLQVVASLLNLHARGATSQDAADAYASIQRRVDALAVVHRNHFAELEENRGVALKSLLSELGANLRANAPANAANMQVRLSVEPVYATQDVAVSVAFLITELVEYAMFCDAPFVTVTMEQTGPATASLAIETEALQENVDCDPALTARFERIVTGLSRQLRSVMAKDLDRGRFSLDIAIVGRSDG